MQYSAPGKDSFAYVFRRYLTLLNTTPVVREMAAKQQHTILASLSHAAIVHHTSSIKEQI